MAGCWFKNNSVAISVAGGTIQCTSAGVRIEGTNGQALGGLNPQYGLICRGFWEISTISLNGGMAAGVTVVGQYDVAGIHFSQQGVNKRLWYPAIRWRTKRDVGFCSRFAVQSVLP